MFVGVKYYKEPPIDGYAGNTYTYKTDMPLHCGELVNAPVKNRKTGTVENKKAMVVEITLSEPPFECAQITSLWTEEV